MAITHFGNKMLRGTKLDRVSDSLGSSADGTNTGVTLSDGYIKQSIGSHTGNNGGNYYRAGNRALGSTLNTNWVFRFRYKPTALNSNSGNRDGDGMGIFITDRAYDDNTHDGSVGTTKGIGYAFRSKDSNSTWYYNAYAGTSSSSHSGIMHHSAGQTDFSDQATVNEEYYVEIIKNGTTVTVTQRSGSHSASATETETLTTSLSGFNHISIISFDGNGNTQPVIEAEIRDIELWDNTTSASGTATWSGITDFTHGTGTTGYEYKLGSGSYSFDGTNDKVDTGDKFGFLTQTGTIAFWMKPTTFNDNDVLFDSCNASSSNNGVVCKVASASNLITFLIARGGSSSNLNYTFGSNPSGKWTHLAFTYDGTTAKIYENGTQVASGSVTSTTNTPTHNLHFGEAGAGQDGNYDGLFDDIGIWNRVLTATEIGKLVNNNNDGSTGWTSSDTDFLKVDSGALTWTDGGTYNYQVMSYDLGSALSDTQWTMRFKANFSGSASSDDPLFAFVLANTASNTFNTSSSVIGVSWYNDRNNGWSRNYSVSKVNATGAGQEQSSPTNNNYTKGTDYYIQIERTSATAATIKVYTDSGFSTQHGSTLTITNITSSLTGLRYLNAQHHAQGNGMTGTVDDVKIWDGTNTTSGTPDHSFTFTAGDAQLVSSLTDKSGLKAYYSMDSTSLEALKGSADYETDFSSSTGWTQVGSWISISGNKVSFSGGTTADHRLHRSITAVSDTKWTMRFKYKGNNDYGYIALSSGTANPDDDNTDWIGLYGGSISNNGLTIAWGDSASMSSASWIGGLSANTDYWVSISRLTSTSAKLEVYSDSNYSTLVGSTSTTSLPSSITGLDNIILTSIKEGGNSTGTTWEVDDLAVYDDSVQSNGCKNDASSTSDLEAMTNLPTNTVFLQTDDTPSYWWKQSDNTWKLDGGSEINVPMTSDSWTFQGNQGAAHTHSIDNGVKWVSSTSGNGSGVAVGTIGTTLGSKWVARYNWTTSSSYTEGGNGYVAIGLSDDSTYGSSDTAQTQGGDSAQVQWHVGNNSGDRHYKIRAWDGGSNTNGSTTGGNTVPWENSTTQYFELSYDGSTLKHQRYTDSTYSTAHSVVTPNVSVSGITGLTHIVFGGIDTGSAHGGFTLTLNEFKIQKGFSEWQ